MTEIFCMQLSNIYILINSSRSRATAFYSTGRRKEEYMYTYIDMSTLNVLTQYQTYEDISPNKLIIWCAGDTVMCQSECRIYITECIHTLTFVLEGLLSWVLISWVY